MFTDKVELKDFERQDPEYQDLLRRVQEWVEGGKPPDYVIARHRTFLSLSPFGRPSAWRRVRRDFEGTIYHTVHCPFRNTSIFVMG